MDKLPFRARQMHPAIEVRVEPDGEQALRLVLVAVDNVALTSKVKGKSERRNKSQSINEMLGFTHCHFLLVSQ